jgi:uncharacterized caspase-like protein
VDTSETGKTVKTEEAVSGKTVVPEVVDEDKPQIKSADETVSEPVAEPTTTVEPKKMTATVEPDDRQEPPMDDDMGIFSNSAFESDQDSQAEPLSDSLESRVPKAVLSEQEPPSETSESKPLKAFLTEDDPQEKPRDKSEKKAQNNVQDKAPEKVPEETIVHKEAKVASVKTSEPELLGAVLKMKSRPQGADIYIDGEYKGKTPAELKVSAEKHEVRIALEGHGDWKAQLDLRKGGEIPLSVRLLPD